MKYLFITVFVALLVGSVGIWAYNIGTLSPRVMSSNHDAVQAVCDYAHTNPSGEWEQACGLAQSKTYTEYTCDVNGTNCRVRDL